MKKSPKGILLASNSKEIQVQGHTNSPAGRVVGRELSVYRIPATHATLNGKSHRSCHVNAERSKPQTEKTVKTCNTKYCQKCYVGLQRAVFWIESHNTELLGVKVTVDFQRQCHKNLISVQCVNCSGSLVTINFVIPASKFPLVVSGSKCA
jgi:hypothetical protein